MITYKKIAVFFLATFFFVVILISKSFFSLEKQYRNRLYPNVYIDQQNFGEKTKADVINYFSRKNQDLNKIFFSILIDNVPVGTLSGYKINLHYDGQGLTERAYLIGRSSNALSRYYQKIASLFFNQSFAITSNIDFDQEPVRRIITNLEESLNKPAKNALFKFENNKVISFRQEELGLDLDENKFYSDFTRAVFELKAKKANKMISIKKIIIQPEITLAKDNDLGIKEFIGQGQSDFSHSIPERIHNIILASSKFDGVLIPKDKIFSFNQTVGDISSLTGYKPAYIIKGGKTVLGDGGGVCQVSTTFFRAALNTGLPIIERNAHAYRVGYYENDSKPGFDATVFAPSVDLKIKNDTTAYILIQTEIDKENNLLYFKFYGKKDSRRVTISSVTVWDVQPPPEPIYQDDPTSKKGVVKQIDFAAWGSKASFNYRVNYANGQVFEKSFFSNYRPWQAVFLVGTAD